MKIIIDNMGILVALLLTAMFLMPDNLLGKYNLPAKIVIFLIFMDLWARRGKDVFKIRGVRINQGALDMIAAVSLLALFFWISFFAPLIGARYQRIALIIITGILFVLLLSCKGAYKLILDKKDLPLLIFLLATIGGLVNITDSNFGYQHFWYSIFPVPFLYLFAKLSFQERYEGLILRFICVMAALVAFCGFIELVSVKNVIYMKYINSFCYRDYIGIRMMSTHIHPAPLGTYLVAVFPLSLVLYKIEKNKFFKRLSVALSIIICTAILFTFSRGVFIGLVFGMIIFAFFQANSKRVYYWILLFPVLIFIMGSLFEVFDFYKYCRFGYKDLGRWFLYSRKIEALYQGIRMLFDHPFFGVGLGHYRVLFDSYFPLNIAKKVIYDQKIADCMYVTILAETGIIGFTGFLVFIGGIFKNAYRSLKAGLSDTKNLPLLGFFAGFCAMMCSFLTYDGLYWTAPSYMFWLYAGIISKLAAREDVKC